MKEHKTILVVEDDKSLRDAIVSILTHKDLTLLEAQNGKEAVEQALDKHPDLILLDLVMPEMDGMAALKRIREDAWGRKVPVIILTNLSATQEQLVEDVATHKPLYYLVKSDWKLHDVADKVGEVLRMPQA